MIIAYHELVSTCCYPRSTSRKLRPCRLPRQQCTGVCVSSSVNRHGSHELKTHPTPISTLFLEPAPHPPRLFFRVSGGFSSRRQLSLSQPQGQVLGGSRRAPSCALPGPGAEPQGQVPSRVVYIKFASTIPATIYPTAAQRIATRSSEQAN